MADEDGKLHSGRFSIIPSVVLDDPRVTPTLLRLLCVLGAHGNELGYCWPKLTTISRRMGGVSKSAISQGLRKLRELGYLEVTPQFDEDGARTVNMYRILFDLPLPQLNGPQLPELNRGLAPELNGGLAPELNTITTHINDQNNTKGSGISGSVSLSTAAASHAHAQTRTHAREGLPEAAAAEKNKNDELAETTEAVRGLLRMTRDKTPGLRLIVAQYPHARAWLCNQANLCFETLRVRPLELKHFSNWLDEWERRRAAAREEEQHDESTTTTETSAQTAKARRDTDELTDDERETIKAELNARVARLFGANTPG